jgi:ATP-dependent RNA helicase DeaD
VLSRLVDLYNPELSLVFCNTRKEVDRVNMQLQARGYSSDAIHGGLNQNQRDHVMNKFKNGVTEILVATNVAARGIDIDGIEIVFNYDVPFDTDYYVHRIGRTGRAGNDGKAFTFIVGKDIYKLKDIQKYIKKSIPRKNIPTLDDIEEARFEKIESELLEYIDGNQLEKYINYIENFIDNDYTAIEIAAALLKKSMDNQEDQETKQDNVSFQDTGAEAGMVRLFINKGKRDNISPKHIVGAISGETSLSGDLIGVIDIYENFTFVEVPKNSGHEVLNIMKNNQIRGNTINIEPAKPKAH